LSVPVGDAAVFQAVSHTDEAFDETDLELAELLAAHVAATLDRIEAESRLRTERDRLDALFGNIPDAAIAFEFRDGVPVATRVNDAFERTFGYSSAEVVGEDVDEFIVPADRSEQAVDYNRSLQAGENVRAEVRRLTVEGPRDFLLYVVPLALGEANVAGYAIYSDLTELKERERELRRQNERLEEFAGVVSHDLRNPLNVADGYLELAREEREDPNLARAAD
ncbi:PAS domain S-box protein, partial [Halobium palmae]